MSTLHKPARLAVTQAACRYLPPIVSQRIRAILYPLSAGIDDDYALTARGQTGSPMHVCTSEYHGYCFAVHGYFDWRNIAIARALVRPGDTVIEIGANIGTETLGFSDVVGAEGRVVAFEPLPSNRAMLEETAAHTLHRNITVMPLALSNEETTLQFAPPPEHQTGSGFIVHGEMRETELVSVDCRTLDSMAKEVGRAHALFIDVEGEEVRVLRGAKEYIRSHMPYIVVEAIAAHLERSGFSLQEMYDEIHEQGYDIYEIQRLGVSLLDVPRVRKGGNWLCVPAGDSVSAERAGKAVFAAGTRPCIKGINPLTR